MIKTFLYCVLSLAFFSLISIPSYAQCSDAGICQLGNLNYEKMEKQIDLSLSYKNGYSGKEDDVVFHSFQLGINYELFEGSSLGLLIPYNLQSGPAGNVKGIGDLIISWTRKIISGNTSTLNASVGVKLATGDVNKEPLLPIVYQPGLGSNDLLFAVDYYYKNFGIGAGYQLAGKRNEKENIKLKTRR